MDQEPIEKETTDKLKSRIHQWQGYIEQTQKTVKFAQPEQKPGPAMPSRTVVKPVSHSAGANAVRSPQNGTPAPVIPNRVLGGYEAQKAARQAVTTPEPETIREPAHIVVHDPFEADPLPYPKDLEQSLDTPAAEPAGGFRTIDVFLLLGVILLVALICAIAFLHMPR